MFLVQDIYTKDKKIRALKTWPKPKSIYHLQVFPGFPSISINISSKASILLKTRSLIVLIVKCSIYLSLILTFWLSNKGLRIIVIVPTSILKIINSTKNSLILVDVAKENRIIDGDIFGETIKNLFKSQKFKNIKKLIRIKFLEQTS